MDDHPASAATSSKLFERFRFINGLPEETAQPPLEPVLCEVEDLTSGAECVLKLWRKTGTALDEDLRQLWRHEMRQVERVMASEGAREVIVDILEFIEDPAFFGVLLDRAGLPLDALSGRVARQHWLKNLGNVRARTLWWRNVRRLATAFGLVHAQGLVHGRFNASAVMTEGADVADFKLCGFEWSLWLSADTPEHAHAQLARLSTVARPACSFAEDWFALGRLIADCFGIRVSEAGELEPAGSGHFPDLSVGERGLLKRLVAPARLDVLDAGSIVEAIDDLIVGIGRGMAVRSGAFILMFERQLGLGNAVYQATDGAIAVDDYRQQLDWVRADVSTGVTLLIPPDFDPATNQLRLVSESAVYTLRPFSENGAALWDIAVCRSVRVREDKLAFADSRQHKLPQPIEVAGGPRDATALRARLGPDALDWSAFWTTASDVGLLSSTERIQHALRLVQVVEALMKSLEIYPIEVLSTAVRQGRHTVDLRAKPDNERDRFAQRIGMTDSFTALRRLFEEDHRDAEAEWRLSQSQTLGASLETDVTARFVDVVNTPSGRAYRFDIDETLPSGATLFLRASRDIGNEQVLLRRLRNIKALDTRVDLAEMLDDPWRVRRSSREALSDDEQQDEWFRDLDAPKRRALQRLWSALPSFCVVGPPGVGKTKLATETVRRRFVKHPSTRMLLTAQGHDALDHLHGKLKLTLAAAGLNDLLVVRSTVPDNRPGGSEEVHRAARDCLERFKDSALVQNAPAGLRQRVTALVTAAAHADARGQPIGKENRSGLRAVSSLLLDSANIVVSTLNSPDIENLVEVRDQFDWVIVEEAAKATGPELVGALSLSGRRLLIGDHRQLPPFQADRFIHILSDHDLVQQTLQRAANSVGALMREGELEGLRRVAKDAQMLRAVADQALRLFEPFRAIVVEDEQRAHRNPTHRPISDMLTEQRRMDPAIARVVSETFYDGVLTTEPHRAASAVSEPPPFEHIGGLPRSPVTVVEFPHVSRTGQRRGFERGRPRWHNPAEVDAVVDVLRCVRARSGLRPKLAVLSPYQAQVDQLSQRLMELSHTDLAHLSAFDPVRPGGFVGTVDSFQGSEAHLVILSLVRNNPNTGASAVGFLRDHRRMNVALSRAMSQLVVVGSLEFLREAVRGVNPDGDSHDLSFLTTMCNTIDALARERRADGVPLAAFVSPDRLKARG